MVEFFDNIWQGILSAWPQISTVFGTGTFATAFSALIVSMKQKGTINNNTISSKNLLSALKELDVVKSSVAKVENVVDKAIETANHCLDIADTVCNKVDNALAEIEEMKLKANAMLDVMSVVYSTVKNDEIRNTVNNIITNAKYTAIADKTALQKELSEVQNMIVESKKTLQLYKDAHNDKEVVEEVVETEEVKKSSMRC